MNNYFMGQDGFNWFVGVVEDRADPDKAGRVRVRCLGYDTADIQKIPKDDLPWASVMMPVTAGANSGIGVSPISCWKGHGWSVSFVTLRNKNQLLSVPFQARTLLKQLDLP